MKFSQFNSVIPIGLSKHLLYNARTDRFISFNSNLSPQINGKVVANELEIDSEFYKNLCDAGALIYDDVNEIDLVKEMSCNARDNTYDYILIVNPTTNCNFNCWYCYETHNKQSKMSDQTIGDIEKLISKTILEEKELKNFVLSIFGGEPLLYFKQVVKPLMEYVRNICKFNNIDYSYVFTTNGYLIDAEMLDYFKLFEQMNFQITVDGCRELHNKVRISNHKDGSYDKIIDNIKSLLSINHYVTLRVNYTADNVYSVAEIYDDIKDIPSQYRERLVIDLHRIWQDSNNSEVVEDKVNEAISNFRKDGFYAKQQNLDNLRRPCYADKVNGALVNYNGDVFRCTAVDFETFPRDGYLNSEGVIIWENDAHNRRMNIRFKNEPCLPCAIMPICCGGCSQKLIDGQNNEVSFCINGFDKATKDKIITDRFYDMYIK